MHEDLIAHWPRMVRAAQAIVGSRHDAEDCAAACLAEVCAQPPVRYESLEAFLVTVTKRRAIDLVRTREAERRRNVRLLSRLAGTGHDHAEDVADRAEARWWDDEARRELRPHVYSLLERLAADVPIEDAAAELGMTRRAAESHLLRARRQLRAALPKAMAGLAAALASLRRGCVRSTAPAATALSAVCLILLPSVAGPFERGRDAPLAIAPAHSESRPATQVELAAQDNAPSLATDSRRRARPMARQKPSGRYEKTVVEVKGPGKGTVWVKRGNTGGNENGPVEEFMACLRDFQVTPQEIGCSG